MANKKRRCTFCKEYREADQGMALPIGFFCNSDHAYQYAKAKTGKAREKQARQVKRESAIVAKADRKAHKVAKESLKGRSDYLREAQTAVNSYVRARDKGKPCISCGCGEGEMKKGGTFDAGHWRSVGSAPHMRFNTLNISGQCKRCNRYTFDSEAYRSELIKRIGLELVEKIASDQSTKKYSIDYLKRMAIIFRKKARVTTKRNNLK